MLVVTTLFRLSRHYKKAVRIILVNTSTGVQLLVLGKEHIFVWETKAGWLHENEAAAAIVEATAGDGLTFSEVKEGKINYVARYSGILKIDVEKLNMINTIDQVVLSTLHNNRPVQAGQVVAATRVIPLVISEDKIKEVQKIGQDSPVVTVRELKSKRIGIVTTGSEIYKGRIKDGFGPTLERKMDCYGCAIIKQIIVPDDIAMIKQAIGEVRDLGADIILTTGGMSVDPDDLTPLSIRELGAHIVSYGSPVLPGAMFLLAYWDGIPLMGLPGCVMYAKQTVFDLVFPRILTGEVITRQDLAGLGHGGLCLDCPQCRYPDCGSGKG